MKLYINCCVRSESRTARLAGALLEKLGGGFTEVRPLEDGVRPLSRETLARRTEFCSALDFSDPMFDMAKQFAAAEEIVIAAPFWDLSYPAQLKDYLENIYVTGLTSRYTPDGRPEGLCRAKKLWYVTTAGGKYTPDFSYDHIRTLAQVCFGIPTAELVCAEFLDIVGNDAEEITEKTIEKLKNEFVG